jgi:hypothetical protein
MVCLPATSEAEARWPRFGLVVVATYSRRDNKDQMIRPQVRVLPTKVISGNSVVAFSVIIVKNATNLVIV